LSSEDEIALENKTSSAKDYSTLSKKELLQELCTLVESGEVETVRPDVEAVKSAFYKIFRQEQDAMDMARLAGEDDDTEFFPDALEQEFKTILNKYRASRMELLRSNESVKEDNYKRKLAIIDELKELVNEEENLNLTFQKFHDIQARWREIGQVPQNHIKDLWETWHYHVEIFYDYVKINKELRDLDLKRNLEAKEKLIERAEALLQNASTSQSFAQLQTLHNLWRETGPVPRDQKEIIWERFKEITAKINKKHQSYSEQRKEEQQNNLRLKHALCERAENLNQQNYTTAKAWQKASEQLIELLDEWKTIGFVPRKENTEAYARFKKARNEFFAKRREHYKAVKQENNQNLKEKKALCEQAEAIMNSEDWKETTDALIALQKRWKETGVVPRKHSDALWKRFREACDVFFNRKSEHFSAKGNQYAENLAAKEQLIIEIETFVPDGDAQAAFEMLRTFQQRWREIGYVPMKYKEKIQKRYQNAVDKQFRNLKISDAEKRVLRFKGKLETMSNAENSGKTERAFRNERDKLYSKIIQLGNSIACWENNIGFFSKSKNADNMIAEVQRKIEKAKEDIKVLEEQIKLIDKKYDE
jgi:hypothetical protein